jgi:uncharacterized protein YjbI with pentapeptide repeats
MSIASALALVAQATVPANAVTIPMTTATSTVAKSCRVGSGLVDGTGSVLPPALDGRKFRTFAAIAALRKATPTGQIVVIEGGDLSGQKVGAVDLSAVCFIGTRFVNTVWTGTNGLGIGFIGADLTGARLHKVIFNSVLFRNATLANVNAAGARLSFGQMDGGWSASLANLNLDNAQMIGFRFICGVTTTDGCPFDRKRISMRGTDLSEAKLSSFAFWDTTFTGAQLNNTEIGLDQISRFEDAVISGPIALRSGEKTATLAPADFMTLRKKIANADPDRCATPETPLFRVICASAQGSLARLHSDVDALYRISAVDKSISLPTQPAFQAALESCITKDEATATKCLAKQMNDRRDILIAQMLREKPLERTSKALYVSNDVPYAMADIAALSPLLAGIASSFMLVRNDSKGKLVNVRVVTILSAGNRCVLSHSVKRGVPSEGFVLRVWPGGADFNRTVVDPVKGTCPAYLQSGPLVQIPVSNSDFDALWNGVSG